MVSGTGIVASDFEALVRLHHRRLMAYALALTPRADAAEDLVQEALLVAHRELGRFDASRDFGAWARGIVRMKFLEWARAQRLKPLDDGLLESLEDEHRAWDRAAEEGRGDALAAVRECLKELPDLVRETVRLFYFEGRSCAEVAARTGSREDVVRKRLQRAREWLEGCVRRHIGG